MCSSGEKPPCHKLLSQPAVEGKDANTAERPRETESRTSGKRDPEREEELRQQPQDKQERTHHCTQNRACLAGDVSPALLFIVTSRDKLLQMASSRRQPCQEGMVHASTQDSKPLQSSQVLCRWTNGLERHTTLLTQRDFEPKIWLEEISPYKNRVKVRLSSGLSQLQRRVGQAQA